MKTQVTHLSLFLIFVNKILVIIHLIKSYITTIILAEQSETATYARRPAVNTIHAPNQSAGIIQPEGSTTKKYTRNSQNTKIAYWIILRIFSEQQCWRSLAPSFAPINMHP